MFNQTLNQSVESNFSQNEKMQLMKNMDDIFSQLQFAHEQVKELEVDLFIFCFFFVLIQKI